MSRCACGGEDLCPVCLADPADAAPVDPHQHLLAGGRLLRDALAVPARPLPVGGRRDRRCEACGSAPGGPVAREPFDWNFSWLCVSCAAPAQERPCLESTI